MDNSSSPSNRCYKESRIRRKYAFLPFQGNGWRRVNSWALRYWKRLYSKLFWRSFGWHTSRNKYFWISILKKRSFQGNDYPSKESILVSEDRSKKTDGKAIAKLKVAYDRSEVRLQYSKEEIQKFLWETILVVFSPILTRISRWTIIIEFLLETICW